MRPPMARGRRGKNTKLELLGGVSLFSACNKTELRRIASLADQVEVKAGSVLMREGDTGTEFFVICAGNGKATELMAGHDVDSAVLAVTGMAFHTDARMIVTAGCPR